MVRPIVKTDKHELTWSALATDAGTANYAVNLVTGVDAEDKGASNEAMVGSHVKSIYIEFNCSAETVTNPKVLHWEIIMMPNGNTPTAYTPSGYYQVGRNQIIKRGMEMLPKDVSTVYKRQFVVRIPKKAKRVALGDLMNIVFRCSSTESINICGFAIYKEFY